MITFVFAELSKRLVFFWLMALTCAANAGEFNALLGSDNFQDFTPAERALFEDAHHRFKKYEIPMEIIGSAIYWIDNDRVAFSSRSYLGWKARPEDPSHIISYNVRTQEIVDSGYRGILRCLNHQGDMLIHQADKEDGTYSKPESYRWFSGKWGNPLQPIEYLPNTFIPTYLCHLEKIGPLIHRYSPEELPEGSARFIPLLPGDGILKESVSREGSEIRTRLYLIKPDKKEIFLSYRRLSGWNFIYQPWDDSYFEAGTSVQDSEPRSIRTDGSIKENSAPLLIQILTQGGFPSAGGDSFRDGFIWTVHQSKGYWRKQGIYIQNGQRLIRVETGEHTGHVPVSPNGCNGAFGVKRGDPFDKTKDIRILIIDLCNEEKQK